MLTCHGNLDGMTPGFTIMRYEMRMKSWKIEATHQTQ